MEHLETIAEHIHKAFESRTLARERALSQTRTLTRKCASAIRAVHRGEFGESQSNLEEANQLAQALKKGLADYPDLYYTGYTQDALKEYAEASIVHALIMNTVIPTPEELGLENSTYLNGLAEATGELRRRCLDILRHGYSEEAERLAASGAQPRPDHTTTSCSSELRRAPRLPLDA